MTEIVAAESAGPDRPCRVDGGVFEKIKEIRVNRSLQLTAAAHQDVAAPQLMPRLDVLPEQGTQAALPCVAGGREILRRAAAPVRAGGGHEFGESIMMIAPYLDLDLESGGVGRCLDGLVNALQIRRHANRRRHPNASAANFRAPHDHT